MPAARSTGDNSVIPPAKHARYALDHTTGWATEGVAVAKDIKPIIEAMFKGVEAKDVDQAVAHFSDDIQLYDPHYPYKDMRGIAEVRAGLTWAFDGMKSMGFDIDRWFLSDDGLSAVVEVSTHHVLNAGNQHLNFPQVFVLDTDGTKITKMRAYEPYGPGGGVGFGLAIGHTIYRLTHRKKK